MDVVLLPECIDDALSQKYGGSARVTFSSFDERATLPVDDVHEPGDIVAYVCPKDRMPPMPLLQPRRTLCPIVREVVDVMWITYAMIPQALRRESVRVPSSCITFDGSVYHAKSMYDEALGSHTDIQVAAILVRMDSLDPSAAPSATLKSIVSGTVAFRSWWNRVMCDF